MKKIALVVKEIEGGGIQKSYLTLFHSLRKYGYDAWLFVLVKPKGFDNDNERIIFLGGKTGFQKGLHLRRLMQKHAPFSLAIVNAEYMKKYIPLERERIFFTVHVMWSQRLGRGISRWTKLLKLRLRYFHQNIVAVSRGIQDDLLYKIKVTPRQIHIIPDPYDIDDIAQKAAIPLPASIPENYIVAVGSLLDVKRYDLMIDAFSQLADKSLHLVIVGGGRRYDALRQEIVARKLRERVHLIGFDTNPYRYIRNAKLLVLSSDSEGFSRVLIEALILKKPIVSTDCTPIFEEDFFPSALKKYIVPKGNAAALAQSVEAALREYPEISSDFYHAFADGKIIDAYLSLIRAPE